MFRVCSMNRVPSLVAIVYDLYSSYLNWLELLHLFIKTCFNFFSAIIGQIGYILCVKNTFK